MADFCKQCSIYHFDADFGDFRGLTTPEDTAAGQFGVALCEGCETPTVSTLVDHEGKCVDPACRIHAAKIKNEISTGV